MATTIFDSFTIASSSETPFTMSLFGIKSSSLNASFLFDVSTGFISQTASNAIQGFSPGKTDFAVTSVGSGLTSTQAVKRSITDNSVVITSQSNLIISPNGDYIGTVTSLTTIGGFIGSIVTGGGSSSIQYGGMGVDITSNLPGSKIPYYVYINDVEGDNVWGETYALTHQDTITYDSILDLNTIILTSSTQPFTGLDSSTVTFFFVGGAGTSTALILEGSDTNRFKPFFGSFNLSTTSDQLYTAGALNKYTTKYGSKSQALGPYSTAYGQGNINTHVGSFVAGNFNVTTLSGKFGQFICGEGVGTGGDLRFPSSSDNPNSNDEKFIVGMGGLLDYTGVVNNEERFLNFEVIVDLNGSSSMIIPYTFNNLVGGAGAFIPNPKTGSMFYHLKANRLLIYNGTSWVSRSFS